LPQFFSSRPIFNMEAHGPCSSCTAESELVVYEGERVCSRLHNVLKMGVYIQFRKIKGA
jgi:hypothetical protein